MNEAKTSLKQSQCAIRHNTAHPVLRGTLRWLIRKLIRHFRKRERNGADTASYPDVSLSMCAQRKTERRQRASPAVCTLPMVPCGSSLVNRFALASAMRKTKPRRRSWSRSASRNCFWDCYSGRAGQLLFKFIPCP